MDTSDVASNTRTSPANSVKNIHQAALTAQKPLYKAPTHSSGFVQPAAPSKVATVAPVVSAPAYPPATPIVEARPKPVSSMDAMAEMMQNMQKILALQHAEIVALKSQLAN